MTETTTPTDLQPLRPFVFLDLETTGLDPDRHEVWEIAWAVDGDDIRCHQVPHSIVTANADALLINRYGERRSGPPAPPADEWELRAALTGATVVGSNPYFDCAFLLARWRLHASEAPWHHRLFDVGAYAAGVLGLDHVPGLAEVVERLQEAGYGWVPTPDHTAAGDVAALRDAWRTLRAHRRVRLQAAS